MNNTDTHTHCLAPAKPVWQSWTVWFNGLTLLVIFLEQFTSLKVINYYVTDPAQAQLFTTWLTGMIATVNILLRVFKTAQPVEIGR